MTNNTLFESVDYPSEAINTVLEWIKSEQVRIINNDRTFSAFRGKQVDHLSETRTLLTDMMNYAEDDNRHVIWKNERIQDRIDREAFNKAQEETLTLLSEKSAHKKICVSYVECTCRNK